MDFFIYLMLGFFIIYVEIKRSRYFLIDHLTLFHGFFFLVYVLAPLALLFYGDEVISKDLLLGKYYLYKNPYTSLIIFVSYLFFLAGYYFKAPRNIADKIKIEFGISQHLIMQFMPLVYIFLVGIIVIYVQGEGGLMRTINNAELYRGGVIFAKYGYLTRLFPLNQILLFYFFYKLFLEKKPLFRKQYIVYFSISLIIFFLMVALANSRGFLIMTLLGMYILTAMYHRRYFIKFLLLAGTFGFLVIKYGDPLFHAIPEFIHYDFETFLVAFSDRVAQLEALKGNVMTNFSHPILSLEVSLSVSGDSVPFRYFVDFLHAFIAILPNALTGVKDPTYIMILNTKLLYGEEISIVLPGILALFSYSLNVVGVFIGMFIYGLFGGFLSTIFKNIYLKYQGSLVFIYLLSMTYGYFVFRGSPRNALMSLFVLLVVIFTLLMFSQIFYKKRVIES